MDVVSRAETTASRRDAIMACALELFVEKGVVATSVDDIRVATGSSVGTVYHHFVSKEGIAVAIYANALVDYQRGAAEALRRARDTRDGLSRLVQQWLRWVEANPARAKLLLLVDHRDVRELGAEAAAKLNVGFFAELDAWVSKCADMPWLASMRRDLFLALLFGPARRYAELWLTVDSATPMSVARPTIARATVAALEAAGRRA